MKVPSGLKFWFFRDGGWTWETPSPLVAKDAAHHGVSGVYMSGLDPWGIYGVAVVDPSTDGKNAKRGKKANA